MLGFGTGVCLHSTPACIPPHVEQFLESIMESVESGDLPDAATLEREVTLPSDLGIPQTTCDRLEPSIAAASEHVEGEEESTRPKSTEKVAAKKRIAREG